MKHLKIAFALVVAVAAIEAYAQCAVTAPPLAGIRATQATVKFVYLQDGGLVLDGGACIGTAIGATGLEDTPAPRSYPFNRGSACQSLQSFAQQALVTDVGRGDGGAP